MKQNESKHRRKNKLRSQTKWSYQVTYPNKILGTNSQLHKGTLTKRIKYCKKKRKKEDKNNTTSKMKGPSLQH